jgi:hypothetical protein
MKGGARPLGLAAQVDRLLRQPGADIDLDGDDRPGLQGYDHARTERHAREQELAAARPCGSPAGRPFVLGTTPSFVLATAPPHDILNLQKECLCRVSI